MNKASRSFGRLAVFVVISLSLSWAAPVFAQVIENPAKPRAANAGRVIVPEEVLTISDEGTSDFYFKRPHGLKIGPNGSLFVLDERQVLEFDERGIFKRNYFKSGQGPGEVNRVRACLPLDRNLILQSVSPDKIMTFNYAGVCEREVPLSSEPRSFPTALYCFEGTMYFDINYIPESQGEPAYVEVPRAIMAMEETSGEAKKLGVFPTKAYVVSTGGAYGLFDVAELIEAPFRGRLLVLSHTSEYLLKIYDPAADKILREFRRAYRRVKSDPPRETRRRSLIVLNGKEYYEPERKYKNDIENIVARGNEIWAVTSTRNKAGNVLIDVYDDEGAFQDCFFLGLPKTALNYLGFPGGCALDGEYLWIVEGLEDGTFAVKKYRIPD